MSTINIDDFVPVFDEESFNSPAQETSQETQSETPKEEVLDNTIENDTSTAASTEDAVVSKEAPANKVEVLVQNQEEPVSVIDNPILEDKSTTTTTTTDNDTELALQAYQFYVDNGILQEKEGVEIKSLDDVEQEMKNLPTTIAQSLVTSTPEIGKQLIDFVFTKGEELTKESLQDFYNTYLDDLQEPRSIEFDESSAKDYLKSVYKQKDLPDVAITATLDALEIEGNLLDTAKAEQEKSQVPNSKAAEKLESIKQEKIAAERSEQEFITNVNSAIEDLSWRAPRKDKIRKELTTGNFQSKLNAAVSSPESFVQLVNFMTYFNENDSNFNFEDFIKQLQSKPAASLKEVIKRDMFTSTTNETTQRAGNPNQRALINLDDLTVNLD